MPKAKRKVIPLTPEQCRAARAMLNISRGELARAAGVSVSMIANFETDLRMPQPRNFEKICKALDEAGIELIPADENSGPGVRLKEPPQMEDYLLQAPEDTQSE